LLYVLVMPMAWSLTLLYGAFIAAFFFREFLPLFTPFAPFSKLFLSTLIVASVILGVTLEIDSILNTLASYGIFASGAGPSQDRDTIF